MTQSRLQLPENFFDETSTQLLAQPEPQYLYSLLYKAALSASLTPASELGLPGRMEPVAGAPYADAMDDRLMLAQPLGSSLFAVKANFSGRAGHTMLFNRPQYTDTTYTESSRQITTNQTISLTPIAEGSEQVTLTIKRFAGPFDQDNTRVAPYAADSFDATMGVHNITSFLGNHMQRDFDRFIDSVYVVLADLASTTVYPLGMTADDDATAAGQFPLTYEQMNRTAKEMDESNLPTLPDSRRVFVCTPTGKKQLKDDPQFARYAEFFSNTNPLQTMGFFAQTPEWLVAQSNTLGTPDNSSSVAIHRAHAMAPGVFLGGVGRKPSIRKASDDNYGETPKLIWMADMAFGLADNRFVKSVRFTEDE